MKTIQNILSKFLFIFFLCPLYTSCKLFKFEPVKWLVYYTDKGKLEDFTPYKVLVFDSDHYPKFLPQLKNKTLIGYINAGEVEEYRQHYEKVKASNIIIEENKNWPGSYYIDARNKIWEKIIIDELIPDLLAKGFNGIFLDTLDNLIYLENDHPDTYKGLKAAAIDLVLNIRKKYPKIKIMVNRGYEILPIIADYIDIVLAESLFTDYNFETKKYSFTDEKLYKKEVIFLQNLAKNNPKLQIYSLDYWDPADKKTIEKIYKTEVDNGFSPYISIISLDKIIKMPYDN